MANMNVPGGYVPGMMYEDVYQQRVEKRDNKPRKGAPISGGLRTLHGYKEENVTLSISKEAREHLDGRVIRKPGPPSHETPRTGQLPHWTEISHDLAANGFYTNMTGQEIDYLESYLRDMRTADDLNAFAEKHTSGNLRQYLKDLAKEYGSQHNVPQSEWELPGWSELCQKLSAQGFYQGGTRRDAAWLEENLLNITSPEALASFGETYLTGTAKEAYLDAIDRYAGYHVKPLQAENTGQGPAVKESQKPSTPHGPMRQPSHSDPKIGPPSHETPRTGQLPHWTEISHNLAVNGFYTNMTRQEISYLESYLRDIRTADDLNAFANKHTSGNLRQYLKDLAEEYGFKEENSIFDLAFAQYGVFDVKLSEIGYYNGLGAEGISGTLDLLKQMTANVESLISSKLDKLVITREEAQHVLASSVKDLNAFADQNLSESMRQSFKDLIKEYEQYNMKRIDEILTRG